MKEISQHSSLSLKNTNKCVENYRKCFCSSLPKLSRKILIYLIFLFILLCTRGEIPLADSENRIYL